MAIINEELVPGGRSGGQGQDKTISFTQRGIIETDDPEDSPYYVALNQQYFIGQVFDGWWITDLSLSETDSPCLWELEIKYGSKEVKVLDADPRDEDWDISLSYESQQLPVDFDINDNAIVNTCGDPFADVMVADVPTISLVAKKNYSTFPFDLKDKVNNVNSDAFEGAAPGTLKFSRMSTNKVEGKLNAGDEILEEDITYWEVSIELTYLPQGWKRRVLNTGYRELVSGSLKEIQVDGKAITTPVLLTASGTKAAPNATPHILEFDLNESTSFVGLFSNA